MSESERKQEEAAEAAEAEEHAHQAVEHAAVHVYTLYLHCIHTCVCIYVCTYTYMYCIHTYNVHILFIYMHTYMHTYIQTCMHAYIHTSMHACMHKYIHPCMHTHMHANKGLVRRGCERERGGRPGQRSAADTEPPHPFGMASWRHTPYWSQCMSIHACVDLDVCIHIHVSICHVYVYEWMYIHDMICETLVSITS